MEQLYTRWGKALDPNDILQEYPRPLLRRESYVNLNGYWDYAFTKKFKKPETYDGRILVPFSPESVLSGVERQLKPDEYLWYRRQFDCSMPNDGTRLILHFGAVDQACRVYVNGKEAARHAGGYLPFSADITKYLRCGRLPSMPEETAPRTGAGPSGVYPGAEEPARSEMQNEIVVAVKDLSDTSYHAKGKQKLKKGGMFYTAQSGIWQTVWMEYVPENYIEELITEPELDQKRVRIFVRSQNTAPVTIRIQAPRIHASADEKAWEPSKRTEEQHTEAARIRHPEPMQTQASGQLTASDGPERPSMTAEISGMSNAYLEIPIPEVCPWTCEEPWLYDFTVTMGEDQVRSYFALRTFTVEPDAEGIPRICLNGRVQFQNGVLDQGYWPDGLYTAPSDDALIFDILEMKKLGFNMIRKHIKIEPQRWYYHCDRLGMVVWQDMVNGGTYYRHWFVTYAATLISWKKWKMADIYPHLLSRTHKEGRLEFVREMKETIWILKGHPSIAVWVIFNEGWGQFQTEDMTRIARSCDSTRLIDQASGWFDQKGGDLQSVHNYFFKLEFAAEKERATVLSEFGGYSLRVAGHSACSKLYGYGTHKTLDSLNAAFQAQMAKVKEQIPKGLCASVYTQLSDVEEEMNGIFTYDREIRKIIP